MTGDARFEDADEKPLRLRAYDGEDLAVLSSLIQDAVFPITEMAWQRGQRRFSILLNRFRWETGRDAERVQSVLAVEDVASVASQGVDRGERATILSTLAITFEPGPDGTGTVLITLAGDGAIRLSVEALEATLRDVTKPYRAPSGKRPSHPD